MNLSTSLSTRAKQPKQSDGNRNPLVFPKEGDIVQLPNGIYVLVDFQDPLRTAFTCSDGMAGAFDYTMAWERFVEGAKVIERGSPETWPWHYTGWIEKDFISAYRDHVARMPTKEQALAYIQRAISEERETWKKFAWS